MEQQIPEELIVELQQIVLPEEVNITEAIPIIVRSIDIQDAGQHQAAEDLVIDLTPEGKSTSVKFSNIKFRLFDFLLEITGLGVQASIPNPNPVGLVLSAIRFIRKMKELTTISLSHQEAEILLALFQLQVDKQDTTIDLLFEDLKSHLSEDQIRDSLDKLEKLSCIEYSLNRIKLTEEVVLARQAE